MLKNVKATYCIAQKEAPTDSRGSHEKNGKIAFGQ